MKTFEEILEGLEKRWINERKIQYFLDAQIEILQAQTKNGKTFEEVKNSLEYHLCEIEIEKIKQQNEVQKQEIAQRQNLRDRSRQLSSRDSSNIFTIKSPSEEGTVEYYEEIERRKLAAKIKVEEELSVRQKGSNKNSDSGETLRQKVLTLLIIRFGGLEVPQNWKDDKTALTNLIDFITFLTGYNRQNVKITLQNPVDFGRDSPKSRNKFINDLRVTEKYFRKIGLSKQADLVLSKAVLLGISEKEITGYLKQNSQ